VINAENMMAKGKLEGGEMEEFEKDAPSSSSQRRNIRTKRRVEEGFW
jgi:hypothetical protein